MTTSLLPPPESIVVSNRLPVQLRDDGRWSPADGGLVRAVSDAVDPTRTVWVGSGTAKALSKTLPAAGWRLRPVTLDAKTAARYDDGFANRTLWPTLHYLIRPAAIDTTWWQGYVAANKAFAVETLRSVAGATRAEGDVPVVWVHDYHLLLVPAILRKLAPGLRMAHFLHTPFPPSAVFAELPWRSALLTGMLGADVAAFQTPDDAQNFMQACQRFVPGVERSDGGVDLPDGRHVSVRSAPASIDHDRIARRAAGERVRAARRHLRSELGSRRLILGVDRLDYTKGIPERLRAVESLALRAPGVLQGSVVYQAAIPTRQQASEYQRLRKEVTQEVSRINRATEGARSSALIELRYGEVGEDRLLALYAEADCLLVTPLRDGMNLVAKEYVATQAAVAGTGSLLLSRRAGAAAELSEAVYCDPFHHQELVACLEEAITLPVKERRRRMRVMGDRIRARSARQWAEEIFDATRANATRANATRVPASSMVED